MNKIQRLCLLSTTFLPAALRSEEKVDLEVIHRIKSEALERSQVMDHLFYLTDVNGPRLTNSPGQLAAARWAVERLKSLGAESARLEPWGKFGRGWSYTRFSVHLKEPAQTPLAGAPMAWCAGTEGPVSGELFLAPFEEKEPDLDLAKLEEKIKSYAARYQGQLQGKVVLIHKARELKPPEKPASERLDEKELVTRAQASEPRPGRAIEIPITKVPEEPEERRWLFNNAPLEAVARYWEDLERTRNKLHLFLKKEGVLAVITADDRGDGGSVFAEAAGLREAGAPEISPTVVLIPEHYNRLARLVEKKIKAILEIDLAASFQTDSLEGANVVAEIPGGKKRDELVMLGAHLDSWHSGTGATDNGAGCAVVIEAMRILKALDLKMDRTVRCALWTGEEQGILGSRGYVKSHFADPATMQLKPEHGRLAGYFNLDNGTGKVRGIYLQGNDMARPIFEAWLAPFRDLGAATLSIRNTGGTDHLSFDSVGLPGFQFLQDPIDYSTRTHHSNLDVYDHAQPSDLVQASMVMAAFVYQAAVREEKLPRKPLPRVTPPAAASSSR
jgi:carboxypeptidase Q